MVRHYRGQVQAELAIGLHRAGDGSGGRHGRGRPWRRTGAAGTAPRSGSSARRPRPWATTTSRSTSRWARACGPPCAAWPPPSSTPPGRRHPAHHPPARGRRRRVVPDARARDRHRPGPAPLEPRGRRGHGRGAGGRRAGGVRAQPRGGRPLRVGRRPAPRRRTHPPHLVRHGHTGLSGSGGTAGAKVVGTRVVRPLRTTGARPPHRWTTAPWCSTPKPAAPSRPPWPQRHAGLLAQLDAAFSSTPTGEQRARHRPLRRSCGGGRTGASSGARSTTTRRSCGRAAGPAGQRTAPDSFMAAIWSKSRSRGPSGPARCARRARVLAPR